MILQSKRNVLHGVASGDSACAGLVARLIAMAVVAVIVPVGGAVLAQDPAGGEPLGRIASFENSVETRGGATADWQASFLYQPLHQRYRVRTGPASRAGILYSDETLHRLNENSEMELTPPEGERPGILSLIFGKHFFSSRAPKRFNRIETPAVTASIRGTEFVVEIGADRSTTITMLEGVVEASNRFGAVTVQSGEEAYVEHGKAPVKRIVVRPRDAVSWALHYPPVLGGADARRLEGMGADGERLASAAALLSAGQVDQARTLIEAAPAGDPIALALRSVIEVATGEKVKALQLAEEALRADPDSAAAALAVSFAAQASFDIRRAGEMAEQAARSDPDSALALARAAEMRMAEGDLKGAEELAERAVRRAPGQARALGVLGWVKLAQFRSRQAVQFFEQAVQADPASATIRLGLGLARIRTGRFNTGREEIQTAVALDPNDALLRAYLGKAYYEEKRDRDAAVELAAAKALDPLDPTPYLYDAIRKQNENRPAEALEDLQASMERNDSRAVYRSRFLLDEDRAVRGVDLARIYNDLGFGQLGLVAARRSADADQSNYSSHLFLAGNYRTQPNFAPAVLSEILQGRIFQPVSVNAARPDVVNESVSFNEYTALLDRPRMRAFGGITYGVVDDDISDFAPNNPGLINFLSIEDPETRAANLTLTANGDRYAAAVAYETFETDGFRVNTDDKFSSYRGFVQFSPTYKDSFQVSGISGRRKAGELPLRLLLPALNSSRAQTDLRSIGAGYHHIFSPGSDFAVSVIDNRTVVELSDFFTPGVVNSEAVLDGPQVELQQVFRSGYGSWVLGAGGFDGDVTLTPTGGSSIEGVDKFANGYAYLHLQPGDRVDITLGAAYEDVETPTGLFPPRDSQISPTPVLFEESKLSPKFGISWYPHSKTTLRGAYFYRLSAAIGRFQTLEPTQVAGFNQFFGEPGGTRSRTYGIGIDQQFNRWFFGGLSAFRRDLDIPEASCAAPNPSGSCALETADSVVLREAENTTGTAYINTILSRRLAFAIDYTYEKLDVGFTELDTVGNFVEGVKTHRVRPELRWFLPSGWFAGVAGNYFNQEIDTSTTFDPNPPPPPMVIPSRMRINESFWTIDARIGYRLPLRYGSVVLEGRNLGDRAFENFRRSIEETLIPAREILLSLQFTL